MTANGQTAAALTADNGIGFRHFFTDMLKANRYFIALFSGICRNRIQQMRGGDIAHRRPPPVFIVQKIIIQQTHNHIGVNIGAGFINNTQPVGIAVGTDSQIILPFHNQSPQMAQGFFAGRRHPAAKARIMRIVNGINLAACRHQQGLQCRFGHAVHRINQNPQILPPDTVNINH